jgi:Cdc6-like AAA superfamily ATPase
VRGKWYLRRLLAPPDQESVLQELTKALLAEQVDQAAHGWEINGPLIAEEVARKSSQLLADARKDFDSFEAARERVVHAYGRADPLVCGIVAAIAAYLLCLFSFPQPRAGLTPEVFALLGISLAVRWIMWRRQRAALMRTVPEAYQQWIEVLRNEVLRPFVMEKRNEQDERLFNTWIGGQVPPGLIEGTEPKRLVVTEAMTQISATARNIHSGSLGISGPRGVGKSTILQFFGSEQDTDIRLVVSAPVDYQPQEFIIHLFSQLCRTFLHNPADLSPIAAETRRHLEELKYLRTYTTNWSASLTPTTFFNLARAGAKERAEQPFTLPELVADFREYSARVATWQRSVREGGRLIIGIDEVDKIQDSDRAEEFLNDIKAIFGVPGCLYIVSLSEDALASFARRAPAIRSAFDSAFDEIVSVGPMTYKQSEQLLFKRIAGVPRPFIALCYVLAGGLPRDLVRAARALIDVTPAQNEKSLPETTHALVKRELESLRQASIRQLAENAGPGSLLAGLYDRRWPGEKPDEFKDAALRLATAARDVESDACRQMCQELVVSLSYYATVTEVFGAERDQLVACLKHRKYEIVDDLAAVRNAMKVNAGLAHRLLEQYRQRNGIGHRHASQ